MDLKKRIFLISLPVALILILLLAKSMTLDIVTKDNYQEMGFYQHEKPKALQAFSLFDKNNQIVDDSALKGQITLIFFGYTFCPDVCPTTLSILNMAIADQKTPPQVILVTVDPERDSAKVLKEYLANFNMNFKAYTGDIKEITKFAKQLDAGFRKVLGSSENDWAVDHTSNIVVINKNGEYEGFIRPPFQVANMKTLLELLERESSGS